MSLTVEKVNHEDPAVREWVIQFLAPHEAHCLFIVGNLKNRQPGAHIYVASRGGMWLGVGGYWDGPKAFVPFSVHPEVSAALAFHVAQRHQFDYLNSISYAAEPAVEALLPLGYSVEKMPNVFMELDTIPPPQPHEECVKPLATAHYEDAARMVRYLQEKRSQNEPVTAEEITKIKRDRFRVILEINGRAVSTANTNGIGLRAFQIIGVATDEAHRGKGYARAVCAYLIRQYAKQGATRSILFTGHDNIAARRCYEKLGFKVTGEFWVSRMRKTTPG